MRGTLLLWVWVLLLSASALSVQAETRVYVPEALEDMGTLTREAFDAKWPATEIADGRLPEGQGFWVAYRHLDLTILIGPYPEKPVAEEALSWMETYRVTLMMGDAQKFGSSTVALLENRLSSESASQASLPPGPLPKRTELSDQKSGTEEPPQEGTAPPSRPGQQGGVGFGFVTTPPAVLETLPEAYPPFLGRALRSTVDLSKRLPPAGNQAPQNSCAGWALGYAIKSYHEAVEEGWSARGFWGSTNLQYTFSPSYIYNQVNGGVDEGAMLPVCLSLVQTNGVCRWPRMPFQPGDFTVQPDDRAHLDAQRYRIDFFGRVPTDDLNVIKGFLSGGFPLLVGLLTDPDFQTLKKDTIWSTFDPAQGSPHAVVLVGYDDRREAFRVFNSWGDAWGKDGFGWIAYDLWPEIVQEVYATKDAVNDPMTPVWKREEFAVELQNLRRTASGGIEVSGFVDIPDAYKATTSVVVVLEDEKGNPIEGTEEAYRTVTGQAGAQVATEGSFWTVEIPEKAYTLQNGEKPSARALLYLDDFGITASDARSVSL